MGHGFFPQLAHFLGYGAEADYGEGDGHLAAEGVHTAAEFFHGVSP